MKPLQSARSRLLKTLMWAAVLAASLVLAACGRGSGASLSPAATASPPATSAAHAPKPLATGAAEPFSRSYARLSLPYRQYRYPGDVTVADCTDRVAALVENGGAHQRLWLMDLLSGRRRLVVPRAVAKGEDWWISEVEVSDDWLVWAEVGPGDDLIDEVDWRLYAAPLAARTLSVGEPSLLRASTNRRMARPLFDLAGSQLAWIRTAWTAAGGVAHSVLVVEDLQTARRTIRWASRGVMQTVSFKDGHIVVGEQPHPDSQDTRVSVVEAMGGKPAATYEVDSRFPLSHWPAWREGWLAWAPLPSTEATYPQLYVHAPSGRTYLHSGLGVDPCFAGGYLFYQTLRHGTPQAPQVREIRALRLSDMTSLVLESSAVDLDPWWHALVSAPDLDSVYVTYLDRARWAAKEKDNYTLVRVYDLEEAEEEPATAAPMLPERAE